MKARRAESRVLVEHSTSRTVEASGGTSQSAVSIHLEGY
jgi:hypothetical protein